MPPRTSSTANPKKQKAAPGWTSNADRKRRAPNCSLASLRALEDEVALESDFVGYFGKTSESHFTWGKSVNQPILAAKTKSRAPRMKKNLYQGGIAALFGLREATLDGEPNGPGRSCFLRCPLEVREKIYSYLLVYAKPIVIKHDLSQVESINLRIHPILRVCQQIAAEASSYMYRDNIFNAVNHNPRITYHLHESSIIAPKFLPLFRNLIIEFPKENWGLEWYTNAAVAIEKLVKSKSPLQSLTFVVFPQFILNKTHIAAGWEKRPVAFADFFDLKGRLMRAFKLLSCKTLNIFIKKTIVMKIPAITLDLPKPNEQVSDDAENGEIAENGENTERMVVDTIVLGEPAEANILKRFLISIDLKYFSPGVTEVGRLTNDDTIKLRREKRMMVGREIGGLKRHFEEVFEDHEKAVKKGKCREIWEDEKVADLVVAG